MSTKNNGNGSITQVQRQAARELFGDKFLEWYDEQEAAEREKLLSQKAQESAKKHRIAEGHKAGWTLPFENGEFKFIWADQSDQKSQKQQDTKAKKPIMANLWDNQGSKQPGKQSVATNYFDQGQATKGYESTYFNHVKKVRRL